MSKYNPTSRTQNPPDHSYDPDLGPDAQLHAEARARGYRLAVRCRVCRSWLVADRSVDEHVGPKCRGGADAGNPASCNASRTGPPGRRDPRRREPDSVRLLDAPTATILEVSLELAASGRAPDAAFVGAELLRRGHYAGHAGDLVRTRLAEAVTTVAYPELLPEYAASVLAQLFRARLAAAGTAFTESAEAAPERDLWQLLLREGKELRGIWERLAADRGEATT